MTMVWEITWPTQSQLLVALKLADHAHNDGSSIYPAKASIARQAQCSESTVSNALRALRNCGMLCVVQEGGSGPRSPTIYRFNVELLEALAGIKAQLEGGADTIEISDELFQKAIENKGSTVAPLDELRGQPSVSKGSTERAKGSIALTPNHHLRTTNKEPSTRAGLKIGFGSEVAANGYTITKADYPEEVAAWRRYANHRGGHDMRKIVKLIDTHGFAVVPSLMPPEDGLSEKSKRIIGDAA